MKRTVGNDWHFNILSLRHHQSQVTVGNSNECHDALVCVVIGSLKNNVIGSEDGEWLLVHFNLVC